MMACWCSDKHQPYLYVYAKLPTSLLSVLSVFFGGKGEGSGVLCSVDIVPKLSIYRSIKKKRTEPQKARYFDNSFDNSINDGDTIER